MEYDIVRMRCEQLAQHMRLQPGLPEKSPGVLLTQADVDTGMQLPSYTCPYKLGAGVGCDFATHDRTLYLHHVCGGVLDDTHAPLLASICPHDYVWMDRMTYVHEAMAVVERII